MLNTYPALVEQNIPVHIRAPSFLGFTDAVPIAVNTVEALVVDDLVPDLAAG
jgi:hypothetical protein